MDQEVAERTVRFFIRWQTGITHKMRISYDSRLFDIRTVIDVRERNRSIEIIAVEVAS